MTTEPITLESLQDLYTRWLEAKRVMREANTGEGLKELIKYRMALTEACQAEGQLEKSIAAYIAMNPGVDLDAAFAELSR